MASLRVNGQERSYDGDPSMPLLWYLRDHAGMTGTKFGCGVGLCGACISRARLCVRAWCRCRRPPANRS